MTAPVIVDMLGTDFKCDDIDECSNGENECDENSDCTNLPGSYDCQCHYGYEGDGYTCENIDECALTSMTVLKMRSVWILMVDTNADVSGDTLATATTAWVNTISGC